MFAGREGLGREGKREKEMKEGGREGGESSRRGAVGMWGGRGAGGRRREGKEAEKETIKLYKKINQQCWTI